MAECKVRKRGKTERERGRRGGRRGGGEEETCGEAVGFPEISQHYRERCGTQKPCTEQEKNSRETCVKLHTHTHTHTHTYKNTHIHTHTLIYINTRTHTHTHTHTRRC